MLRSLAFVAIFGFYLSYHETEALDKECMSAMQVMMKEQTKLLVPCIEKLGLTTGPEKKSKAMVLLQSHLNLTINIKDLIKLETRLAASFLREGIFNLPRKFNKVKSLLTSVFQCIMKCVMIDGKMLAPDGSVDMELAQKAMDNLPDALKDKASSVVAECGHHAAGFDPSDSTCESYRDFIGCMLDVALKMCN